MFRVRQVFLMLESDHNPPQIMICSMLWSLVWSLVMVWSVVWSVVMVRSMVWYHLGLPGMSGSLQCCLKAGRKSSAVLLEDWLGYPPDRTRPVQV